MVSDRFARLPPELRIRILEACSLHDLTRICLASRQMRDLGTPILYRTIDLACHTPEPEEGEVDNRADTNIQPARGRPGQLPRLPLVAYLTERTAEKNIFESTYLPKALYFKQLRLVQTLTQDNPSLGKYVRTLRWTTIPISDDMWTEGLEEEFYFNDCNDTLWAAFSTMSRVDKVDIAFTDSTDREASSPPPLFPTVRSLRLGGLASRQLIKSFLASTSPDRLERLHLNNLQEFAELSGVSPDLPLDTQRRMKPMPHDVGIPGPMRCHLAAFRTKWPNLRELLIDTVGQASAEARHPSARPDIEWDRAAEEERYKELGDFIASNAKSLRRLRFQQGVTDNFDGWEGPWAVRCGSAIPPFRDRPGRRLMDARFFAHILPAITRTTWPYLQMMEIFGVAGSCSVDGFSDGSYSLCVVVNHEVDGDVRLAVRRAIGSEPRLEMRPYATKPFWLVPEEFGSGMHERDDSEYEEESD